jgi:putative SOS response-associated peptidase YedK
MKEKPKVPHINARAETVHKLPLFREAFDLKAMLKPYDPALMEAYAVNRAVNSVKTDTEECIEPAAE